MTTDGDTSAPRAPAPSGDVPPEPATDRPPTAEGDEAAEADAVMEEIESRQNPKQSTLRKLLFLAGTLALFVFADLTRSPLQDVGLIVAILLFHEGGHYLGMRLLGYRNLHMLFIPFLGAVVAGENARAPAYKRILVSFLGPVPGLVLALVLLVLFWGTLSPLLEHAVLFLLILNGFNLLPFFPLDGGRLAYETLFCRNRYLEGGFRALAGLALAAIGFGLGAWLLGGLGVLILLGATGAVKVASIAEKVREEEASLPAGTGDAPSREAVARILPHVRFAFPEVKEPKRQANLVLDVWRRTHTRPPGPGLTLVTLAAHGVAFVLVFTGLLAMAFQASPSSDAPSHGGGVASEADAGDTGGSLPSGASGLSGATGSILP